MADGMGGLIGKFGEVQKGMDAMMLFADLLSKTQKRIKGVMQAHRVECTDKLAEALAKDRLDWMMTDMAAVAEQSEALSEEREAEAERIRLEGKTQPPMPHERPRDWFKADDRVVVYMHNWLEAIWDTRHFVLYVVAARIEPLLVLYAEERLQTGINKDGHAINCSISSPEVMHEWEFQYLKEHPDFAEVFARQGSHLSDAAVNSFLAALKEAKHNAGSTEG